MENQQNRKTTRLKDYNYNKNGLVFITICTNERKCILCNILEHQSFEIPNYQSIISNDVHTPGKLDGTNVVLTHIGQTAEKYILQLNAHYDNLSVEHYVIMPNHIHMLLSIKQSQDEDNYAKNPTQFLISQFISTFKKFTNKEIGENIWQYRSYDHIIRNQNDYEKHIKYIYENPIKWLYDKLYPQ